MIMPSRTLVSDCVGVESEEYVVNTFSRVFAGRKDCWGTLEGGCIKEDLKISHIENHLNGIEALGRYPLLNDGTCYWAVVDFDFKSEQDRISLAEKHSKSFVSELEKIGITTPCFERSKSELIHLWLFFDDPVEATKIRKILTYIANKLELRIANGVVEIFPKQDQLNNGQVGNYVHLPYFNGLNNSSLDTRVMINTETFKPVSLYDFLSEVENSFIDPEIIDKEYKRIVDLESDSKDNPDLISLNSLNSLNSYGNSEKIIQILKPYWNEGHRQELSLCLSGFLSKQGLSWDKTEAIIQRLAYGCGDNEIRQRLASIKSTYNKDKNGHDIKGYSGLAEILKPYDLDKLTSLFIPRKIEINYPKPINNKAYYGLAGDIVRLIEPHSEADSVALLINLLTCFGNIVGNKPHFEIGADNHSLKIFAVLVGESSKSRKGHSFGFIEYFFKAIDEDWENRSQTGLSSGEGLIWAVRDQITKKRPIRESNRTVGYEDVIDDEGVTDKRLLVIESEFASTLKVASREGNILSPVVRNAWDKGKLQTLTKNTPATATGTHISIIGHITKQELLKYLTNTEAGNGFANRFLWLSVKRSKVLPFGGEFLKENIEPFIKRLKESVEFAEEVDVISWAEETKTLWKAIYPKLSEGKQGLIGSLTARAEAYVTRLACVYALLDLSDQIQPDHLWAAIALWDYNEKSIKYIFQNKIEDHLAEKVLQLLEDNPHGLSRSEISNLLNRNYSSEQLTDALSLLEFLEIAYKEHIKPNGRTREIWKIKS